MRPETEYRVSSCLEKSTSNLGVRTFDAGELEARLRKMQVPIDSVAKGLRTTTITGKNDEYQYQIEVRERGLKFTVGSEKLTSDELEKTPLCRALDDYF